MDHPAAEGLGLSLLGESHPGHAGGTVHGWGGDLWGCGLCPLSGKLPWARLLSCVALAYLLPLVCFDDTFCSSHRRTLFPYGIRLPVTKQPQPESGILFGACLTYLPTPLWNTKLTPTASSTCWGCWGGQVPELSRSSSIVGPRGIWSYRRLACGKGTDQPPLGFWPRAAVLVGEASCPPTLQGALEQRALLQKPSALLGLLHFYRPSCLSYTNHSQKVKDKVLFFFWVFLKIILLNNKVLFPTRPSPHFCMSV